MTYLKKGRKTRYHIMNDRGFANSILLIIAVGLLYGGYFIWKNKILNLSDSTSNQTNPNINSIESVNWKIYKNENYNFEFKYPNSYILEANDSISPTYTIDLFKERDYSRRNSILDPSRIGIYIYDNPKNLSIFDWPSKKFGYTGDPNFSGNYITEKVFNTDAVKYYWWEDYAGKKENAFTVVFRHKKKLCL